MLPLEQLFGQLCFRPKQIMGQLALNVLHVTNDTDVCQGSAHILLSHSHARQSGPLYCNTAGQVRHRVWNASLVHVQEEYLPICILGVDIIGDQFPKYGHLQCQKEVPGVPKMDRIWNLPGKLKQYWWTRFWVRFPAPKKGPSGSGFPALFRTLAGSWCTSGRSIRRRSPHLDRKRCTHLFTYLRAGAPPKGPPKCFCSQVEKTAIDCGATPAWLQLFTHENVAASARKALAWRAACAHALPDGSEAFWRSMSDAAKKRSCTVACVGYPTSVGCLKLLHRQAARSARSTSYFDSMYMHKTTLRPTGPRPPERSCFCAFRARAAASLLTARADCKAAISLCKASEGAAMFCFSFQEAFQSDVELKAKLKPCLRLYG